MLELELMEVFDIYTVYTSGCLQLWKPGKPRNLREFVNSEKLRNLKFTHGIYQMCA